MTTKKKKTESTTKSVSKTKKVKSSSSVKDEKILTFNDDDVTALSQLEAIRKRYDMYVGSSDPAGQLVSEALDNSIDEFMNGFGEEITVTLDTKENRITVSDNGRGLPLGMNKKLNKPTIEVLFTHVHAGAKFDKSVVKTSGGKNGVGIKTITALSKDLNVISIRNDDGITRKGTMSFSKAEITEEFKKVKCKSFKKTGTTISFVPDDEILKDKAKFNVNSIKEKIDLKCYINAGLIINFIVDGKKTVYHHKNGILDYIKTKTKSPVKNMEAIYINGSDEDDNYYELTMLYNDDTTDESIISFVNSLPSTDGGTHETGFKKGLTQVFLDYIKNNNLLTGKDKTLNIKGEDIRRGLTCIISIRYDDPLYEGQTKAKLSNTDIDPKIRKIVTDNLTEWLSKNPKLAKILCERIIGFAKATHSAKEKMKKVITISKNNAGLEVTEKFMDCESDNPEEVEIFIVEGNSAKGGVEDGRDPYYQAIYPLRGKILNTNGLTSNRLIENTELNEFLKIEFGTNDLKKIRETLREIKNGHTDLLNTIKSTKIIILCDADDDGKILNVCV